MSGSGIGVSSISGAGASYTTYYSSVEDVIKLAGVKPVDFDFEDDLGLSDEGKTADEKLVTLVTSWLISVKSFIDSNRNRDYTQEVIDGTLREIPPGIHNIALRAAANMAAIALLRRETAVQRVDIVARLKGDEIFTESLRQDLAQFPAKPRFRMAVSKTTKPDYYDVLNQPGTGYLDGI